MKKQRKIQLGILACVIVLSSFFLFVMWKAQEEESFAAEPIITVSNEQLSSLQQEDQAEKKETKEEQKETNENQKDQDTAPKASDTKKEDTGTSEEVGGTHQETPKEETPSKGNESTSQSTPEVKPIQYVSMQIDTLNANAQLDKVKSAALPYLPESGYILPMTQVAIEDGDTAFTVLKRVCEQQGIALIASNGYVKYIANFGEFDAGNTSGWLYKVNDNLLSVGANAYKVTEGDVITWRFTVKQGDV